MQTRRWFCHLLTDANCSAVMSCLLPEGNWDRLPTTSVREEVMEYGRMDGQLMVIDLGSSPDFEEHLI